MAVHRMRDGYSSGNSSVMSGAVRPGGAAAEDAREAGLGVSVPEGEPPCEGSKDWGGQGEGTAIGTFLNILKNIIGSGMLAIPYALSLTGWLGGLILLAISQLSALANLYFIMRSCEFVRSAGGDPSSYRSLMQAAFGGNSGFWTDALVACYTACSLMGYGVLIVQFFEEPAKSLFGHGSFFAGKYGILLVATVVLIPLCSMQTIERLKPTSLVGNAVLAYTVILVIRNYAVNPPNSGGGGDGGSGALTPAADGVEHVDVQTLVLGVGMLQALPTFLFSYNFHYNMPNYYGELKDRSVGKALKIVVFAYITVTAAYMSLGLTGYLRYGETTKSNIVLNLPDGDAVKVCKILLGFMIICTFPVVQFGTRQSVCRLAIKDVHIAAHPPLRQRLTATCASVIFVVVMSSVIPNVGVVVSLNGALFGVAQQCFIPTTCFYALSKKADGGTDPTLNKLRIFAIVIFVIGVNVAVLGMVGTIKNIVDGNSR